MRWKSIGALAALSALAGAAPAVADWKRASSRHFVIYSEQDSDELEDFSRRLEMFDAVVRMGQGLPDFLVGDGNRVTVYVVRDIEAVQKSLNARGSGVAGYYRAGVAGPFAVVPARGDGKSPWSLTEDIIFFHEYGHHLMLQNFATPAPGWLVEGFAEMVSTARFEPDGKLSLGLPANHRGTEVFFRRGVPIETMLKGDYSALDWQGYYTLYGRSWMLTHYLTFDPSRRGQLKAYLGRIARGEDALAAAREVFGDLNVLQKSMEKHARAKQLPYLGIPTASLKVGPIKVEALSPGGNAVLPLRFQSKRGVNEKTAAGLATKIRKVAADYPNDPLVLTTLAEAEHDAEMLDAADAASDRALVADPKSIEAIIYKGRIAMKRGKAAKDAAKSPFYADARKWFAKASSRDPEDPEPLHLLYESFVEEGITPSPVAILSLHRAARLAPRDEVVRMSSIRQYLRDGKVHEAKATLLPFVFNPHARKRADFARELSDAIDSAGPAGALALLERRNADQKATGKDEDADDMR